MAMFGKDDRSFRVTFDTNIRTRRYDIGLDIGNYGEVLLDPKLWIMEAKAEQAVPIWFAKMLSEHKIYPTSYSKYGNEYKQMILEASKLENITNDKCIYAWRAIMFETIFNNNAVPVTDVSMDIKSTLICIIASLLLGLVVSLVYILITTHKDRSPNFILSLVILPALVSVVILLVGSNVARAFSIAGVFTLIRYRSLPGDSKDISLVFLSMAIGLTTGLGYITFAAIITIIFCLVILLIKKTNFGFTRQVEKRLKVVIPEDMNYQTAFDDIFDKYLKRSEIQRVKTTNLGTLYEITYHIIMKDNVSEKEFLDELRCRNGNLTIQLGMMEQQVQQL